MDRANKFRRAAALYNHGRPRMGWRYPQELLVEAVAHCREQRDLGSSWKTISEELGVSQLTLNRWRKQIAAPRGDEVGFRAIRVVESGELTRSEPLALVTPGGFRVEGLNMTSLVELLGRLC